MKTMEWRREDQDRSKWIPAAWENEPDKRQWMDENTGLPCLIVRNRHGALCGYVGLARTHPLHGHPYDDVDVEVHGGVTFAGPCAETDKELGICHLVEPGEDDDVWWFGFDCAHYHDLVPGFPDFYDGSAQYRAISYVTDQVESLAQQLKQME